MPFSIGRALYMLLLARGNKDLAQRPASVLSATTGLAAMIASCGLLWNGLMTGTCQPLTLAEAGVVKTASLQDAGALSFRGWEVHLMGSLELWMMSCRMHLSYGARHPSAVRGDDRGAAGHQEERGRVFCQ